MGGNCEVVAVADGGAATQAHKRTVRPGIISVTCRAGARSSFTLLAALIFILMCKYKGTFRRSSIAGVHIIAFLELDT